MAVAIPRFVFLIFILGFLFISPDYHASLPSQQDERANQIEAEKHALQILNQSSYGNFDPAKDRWLNITGLRQSDNYTWDLLPRVQAQAMEHLRLALRSSQFSKTRNSLSGLENDTSQDRQLSDNRFQKVLSLQEPFQTPPAFYQNVTGIVRGQWSRSDIQAAPITRQYNLSTLAPGYYFPAHDHKRNITGLAGDIRIKLDEKKSEELLSAPGVVRGVKAEVLIQDETSNGDGWDSVMYGVHFLQQGGLLLSTTSERFAGIFALPHLTLSASAYELAQQLLNQSLQEDINKQEVDPYSAFNPWTSTPGRPSDPLFPQLQCELVCYLQQYPHDLQTSPLEEVEQELRYPTGAPAGNVPKLKFSALIFSPDCGFVIESKGPPRFSPQEGTHLTGTKLESFLQLAKSSLLAFGVLMASQIFLLKRQMHDTSTPSTRSRVSFYTVAIMAMGDGFVCISFTVSGMFIDSLFLLLTSTAFLAFICVSFFGMKFLMDVWTVQAPERQEREREQMRRDRERQNTADAASSTVRASVNAPSVVTAAPDTLPLPATAQRRANNATATPEILPPDQDLDAAEADDAAANGATPNQVQNGQTNTISSTRRELGALYSKFYFILLIILFVSLHATSWPTFLRSSYCNLLTFTYLSFWTPQIYRNVMRNCRKALRWDFVVGQSLLRLAPFAYFYLIDGNILFIQTDANAFFVLAAWLWIQVWALVSQEILGPRFFVPNGWAPPAYDYHPVLREGDGSDGESGALLPLGFTDTLMNTNTTITTDNSDANSSTTPAAPTSPVTGGSGAGTATTSGSGTGPRSRTGSSSTKRKPGKRVFDCAICTEDIEVPVISASASAGNSSTTQTSSSTNNNNNANNNTSNSATPSSSSSLSTTLFTRRAYMVTPCRHIFHSACLEGWMRYRLQCPICRESLPPL